MQEAGHPWRLSVSDTAKHTPGPWTFDLETLGCRAIYTEHEFSTDEMRDGRSSEICTTPGLANDEEDEANARLIAAAPDMLKALIDAIPALKQAHSLTRGGPMKSAALARLNAARDAITKAGSTP